MDEYDLPSSAVGLGGRPVYEPQSGPPVLTLSSLGTPPPNPSHGFGRNAASRWGLDSKGAVACFIDADGLSDHQVGVCSVNLRIDEIGRNLRSNDYVPPSPERSPSPEPAYGPDGKRINTREIRYRKKLEDERHRLVTYAKRLDVNYRPPPDYRRPTKVNEKVFIPVKEHQGINFIGLLLGPRGSTLKNMETESGAKIAIRGKGSVKDGKGAPSSYQNQEEDLHCLITADSEDKIKIAKQAIMRIIQTASTVPEAQNELKRKQLRDLAALNGTLRDDEGQMCQICGGVGHKRYNCPDKNNVTNNIICRICGSAGHMARDCMSRNNPAALQEAHERDNALDSEYQSLLAELGAGDNPVMPVPAPQQHTSPTTDSAGVGGQNSGSYSEQPASMPADAPWARTSHTDAMLGMRPHPGQQTQQNFGFRAPGHVQPHMHQQLRFGNAPPANGRRDSGLPSDPAIGSSGASALPPPWVQSAPQAMPGGLVHHQPQAVAAPAVPLVPQAAGLPGVPFGGAAPTPVPAHMAGPFALQLAKNLGIPEEVPLPPQGAMGNEEYTAYLMIYAQYIQKFQQDMAPDS